MKIINMEEQGGDVYPESVRILWTATTPGADYVDYMVGLSDGVERSVPADQWFLLLAVTAASWDGSVYKVKG